MDASWSETLQKKGARIESGAVRDFGNAAAERQAARASAVLADLSHLAALRISGDDAENFLQGQLSCDVKAIPPGGGSLGSYCSPKGRMLASFTLLRAPDEFVMLLSASLAAAIQKRLSMFVLRAKVKITSPGDTLVLMGLAGPACRNALAASFEGAMPADLQVFEIAGSRILLLVPLANAAQTWTRLCARFTPVGSGAWQWIDISLGIPLITAATQDQLIPQMANLELIGGVSFKKGCYTGQEIVARTQYLGKVKRRMFRAHLQAEAAPGDVLYSDDLGAQASGLVLNVQPAPEGGYDLLAVAQLASRESSTVRLKGPDGPALRFDPLPYEIT
jgi:folate-binding protein YgfZ